MGPLVTLITPSFNMARFLGEAVESVLGQTYPDVEYVVLDGGSADGSVDVLRSYGERFRWRSAPDGGAAAAIAEGLREARGEILGWVNADDLLLPGAVAGAVAAFERYPKAAAVYGNAWWTDEAGSMLAPYPVRADAQEQLANECGICQPGCFFRAEAYRAVGGIDPAWGSAFDYDLWIRLARHGRLVHVAQDWARSRMHRGNKTLGQRGEAFTEGMAVLDRHFGYVPPHWIHSEWLWKHDGRDQFFERSHGSLRTWAASLPTGLRRNRKQWRRYLWDWLMLPGWGARFRRANR